ncbi:MAG: hypothetical protein IJH63_00845 [Methanobrevibacter sp.]|nr:hypothetical protein [Methanobrevibacter sp.]
MMVQDLKEIKKIGDNITVLDDAFRLELSYDNSNGTPMPVQDYFRELKSRLVLDGLAKVNLDHAVETFYNYSMQGYCQLIFDKDYYKRVMDNDTIARLTELWGVNVEAVSTHELLKMNIGILEKEIK